MEIIRDKKLEDSYMVATICSMRKRGELRTDYKTQRNPDTWTNDYRDGFIASMIKEEDCDSIKICEQIKKNGVTLWVIDGGHRITTLQRYCQNEFALGANIERSIIKYQVFEYDKDGKILEDEEGERITRIVEFDLKGKRYSDLPIELKEKFDNKKIDYVKHLDCSDEDIVYHIRRYNKQKSMNPSETAITYMPEKASYLKKISKKNRFFKDCGTYSPNDRINGNLDRIVMETVMCTNHLAEWKSNGKLIAKFLEVNDTKKEFTTLNNTLERIMPLVSEKHDDLFTTKNTFIFLTLFSKFIELGVEDKRFSDFLYEFKSNLLHKKFAEYDNVSFAEFDKIKATKDKKTIVTKLDMLEKLMLQFLHINKNEKSETEEVVSTFNFVRENVRTDIDPEDVELYELSLDDYTVEIDENAKQTVDKQIQAFVALVAYAFGKEVDDEIPNWLVDYTSRVTTYSQNQKENYLHIKEDFENYLYKKGVAA